MALGSLEAWVAQSTYVPGRQSQAVAKWPVRVAHVIENKAEAAYRRGDMFDKRRKLMEAWADSRLPTRAR
jgi:hypothetical protein